MMNKLELAIRFLILSAVLGLCCMQMGPSALAEGGEDHRLFLCYIDSAVTATGGGGADVGWAVIW